jgi:hypothetical protein
MGGQSMILVLKLFLTPFFIGTVTLAGRRWGPVISGLMMGLPLTSGPVSIILALQYGPHFAAQAAVGALVGQVSVCVFCLAYTLVSSRATWPVSAAAAMLMFLAATAVWNSMTWTLWPALGVLVGVIALLAWRLPAPAFTTATSNPPRWDLPARMIIATLFVLLLTTVANVLGPQLSGLISPLPVFGGVLAAFTHHQQGAPAAARLLRGVVVGSLAFGAFFLVTGLCLTHLSLLWTYILAPCAALTAGGFSLFLAHRVLPQG